MRICLILEGCYPYVRGGVSKWAHEYITAMPQHEFVLWTVSANSVSEKAYKYQLPNNVVEVCNVSLNDAVKIKKRSGKRLKLTPEEYEAHKQLIACENPDWNILFKAYNEHKFNAYSFLTSEPFLDIVTELCKEEYKYTAYAELFHTLRSVFLPLLYVLESKIPDADIYHAASAGYGGIIGAMAGELKKRPFVLTEHGIYMREREEEILRASWVDGKFKKIWIKFFSMMCTAIYDNALVITSLFNKASEIQRSLGCDPKKQEIISNGIHLQKFEDLPDKPKYGIIDIGAIARIHPVKDIKTLIYSFYELKQHISGARLHILGDTDDGEYKRECIELINTLGVNDIFFLGSRDISEYMINIDFTVLTSISEGQPLSVIESMAAGRPCVATNVGCCKTLLDGTEFDDFGKAGICVPPMDAHSIASAMEFMCKNRDKRIQMGNVGRRRAANSFRHEDMVNKYLNMYSLAEKRFMEKL